MARIHKPSQPLIPPTNVEEVEEIATNAAEAAIAADDTHAPLVDDKVPAANLPSYVDDVLEFTDADSFPEEGETGKIYVALDTNLTYRWSGAAYIQVGGASLGAGDGIEIENNIISIDEEYLNEHLEVLPLYYIDSAYIGDEDDNPIDWTEFTEPKQVKVNIRHIAPFNIVTTARIEAYFDRHDEWTEAYIYVDGHGVIGVYPNPDELDERNPYLLDWSEFADCPQNIIAITENSNYISINNNELVASDIDTLGSLTGVAMITADGEEPTPPTLVSAFAMVDHGALMILLGDRGYIAVTPNEDPKPKSDLIIDWSNYHTGGGDSGISSFPIAYGGMGENTVFNFTIEGAPFFVTEHKPVYGFLRIHNSYHFGYFMYYEQEHEMIYEFCGDGGTVYFEWADSNSWPTNYANWNTDDQVITLYLDESSHRVAGYNNNLEVIVYNWKKLAIVHFSERWDDNAPFYIGYFYRDSASGDHFFRSNEGVIRIYSETDKSTGVTYWYYEIQSWNPAVAPVEVWAAGRDQYVTEPYDFPGIFKDNEYVYGTLHINQKVLTGYFYCDAHEIDPGPSPKKSNEISRTYYFYTSEGTLPFEYRSEGYAGWYCTYDWGVFNPDKLLHLILDETQWTIDENYETNSWEHPRYCDEVDLPQGPLTPNVVLTLSGREDFQFGYYVRDPHNADQYLVYLLDDQFNVIENALVQIIWSGRLYHIHVTDLYVDAIESINGQAYINTNIGSNPYNIDERSLAYDGELCLFQYMSEE